MIGCYFLVNLLQHVRVRAFNTLPQFYISMRRYGVDANIRNET